MWHPRTHRSHEFATQSCRSVDLAGRQAKMVSIENWMPWRNAHNPILQTSVNVAQTFSLSLHSTTTEFFVFKFYWTRRFNPETYTRRRPEIPVRNVAFDKTIAGRRRTLLLISKLLVQKLKQNRLVARISQNQMYHVEQAGATQRDTSLFKQYGAGER